LRQLDRKYASRRRTRRVAHVHPVLYPASRVHSRECRHRQHPPPPCVSHIPRPDSLGWGHLPPPAPARRRWLPRRPPTAGSTYGGSTCGEAVDAVMRVAGPPTSFQWPKRSSMKRTTCWLTCSAESGSRSARGTIRFGANTMIIDCAVIRFSDSYLQTSPISSSSQRTVERRGSGNPCIAS